MRRERGRRGLEMIVRGVRGDKVERGSERKEEKVGIHPL
jgi:hypothetical protein